MRKKGLIALLLIMAAPLIFWGCSDDEDCPTCSDVTQLGVIYGDMAIDGDELELYGYILALDAFPIAVDSITVDGNLGEVDEYIGDGGSSVSMDYDGPAGSLDSGDDVELALYMPGGICRATVTLLDEDDDRPGILGWADDNPYDTVATGSEIVIAWNKVDHADWYLVSDFYRYDSSGTEATHREEYYITDTTLTVPASRTGYNGYHGFSVVAVTGPHPDSHVGSMTCGIIKGVVHSMAYEYFQIIIGNGLYDPISASPVILETPEISISEILMNRQLSK